MAAIDRALDVEERGDAIVVHLSANVADAVYCQKVERPLAALLEGRSAPKILLDFGAVAFGQSALYGFLVKLQQRARERGGSLRLCNVPSSVRSALEITRLDELLEIHADEASAWDDWTVTGEQ